MDADRINHLDIFREAVATNTKVARLIDDLKELRDALGAENGIYARLNRLEQRMAQVVILAAVCGLVIPVAVTVTMDRLWPAATVEVTADPTP